MPHQQVPQIKAKATVKEYKASLGKGCSQLCIGSEDDVSVRRTTLIPPPHGSQTEVWVSLSWEAFSAITLKWNWPGKQTRSLSISPSSPDQACLGDGFFCCSVCLLVWSGTHGYPAWSREEKRRNEGRRGEERWGRGVCVCRGGEDV